MLKGYLALVLHAHLPFIRHPEHENFLEESWLFEAITDTYVPLIKVFDNLIKDNVDFHITLSLSPTLLHMLQDELLISRYLRHLDKLMTLSGNEIERTRGDNSVNKLSIMYHERYKEIKSIFCETYGNNITKAFKKFKDLGKVEVITCCATHGYLPLMALYEKSVEAQIKVAVDSYKKVFGDTPKGIWLPECGYQPGVEKTLKKFGINYFFVETHGILFGNPKPKYNVYSPYMCSPGVAVFGRDRESSKAVWSAKEGYPGDYNYREYYRDIGFDLDYDYIRPYANGCGTRMNTGIKYHKITGETDNKDVYDIDRALNTASIHAANFMFNRKNQLEYLSGTMDRLPIVVSPYDAELFGHWWFEGPSWLDSLLRKIHFDQDIIKTITPSEYLKLYHDYPKIEPSMSSWGYKGYSEVWLDESNDWIYRHLHKMSEIMEKAACCYKDPSSLEKRTLNQMARELLLAQSSDWAFIMNNGTFTEYAVARTKEHVARFLKFNRQLEERNIDVEFLAEAETKYNIFQDIDYSVYG